MRNKAIVKILKNSLNMSSTVVGSVNDVEQLKLLLSSMMRSIQAAVKLLEASDAVDSLLGSNDRGQT